MRIRLEQLNPIIGDLNGNKELILDALKRAGEANMDLLILPEMVITGYPVQDLLEERSFRESCYGVNREIVEATGETALLFGTLTPNDTGYGRKIFNSGLLARNGELLGTTHKALLPTYDIFDDLRYFEPSTRFRCLELDGVKLGVTICEDIWYNENEVQYHTYSVDPAKELAKQGADVIINISASPYTKSKHENRFSMLRNHARKLNLPVLYSNQTGSHTDVIFDGDSMAINAEGDLIAGTVPFQADFLDVELNGKTVISPGSGHRGKKYPKSKEERQFRAICHGLQDYVRKTGVTNSVLLGLSGGIDSALVCAIAAEAVGAENVLALTMPSGFSSEESVTDSQVLAENLGVELKEIPIRESYESLMKGLSPVFGDRPFGVAEENLQSRIRGTMLMAASNKLNRFLLATGNKSEYAVGYATLYGDMNGALAPIGDLWKTEVFDLCRWLNSSWYKKEMIPESIITKPPSAELRPDQKDSDSLPEYEVLDEILLHYIERQDGVTEITDKGFDPELVRKIVRLVDMNEFKRFQAAPILKLSSKSFGTGRRRPIVQRWTGQL